jgi:hypothetical protein
VRSVGAVLEARVHRPWNAPTQPNPRSLFRKFDAHSALVLPPPSYHCRSAAPFHRRPGATSIACVPRPCAPSMCPVHVPRPCAPSITDVRLPSLPTILELRASSGTRCTSVHTRPSAPRPSPIPSVAFIQPILANALQAPLAYLPSFLSIQSSRGTRASSSTSSHLLTLSL